MGGPAGSKSVSLTARTAAACCLIAVTTAGAAAGCSNAMSSNKSASPAAGGAVDARAPQQQGGTTGSSGGGALTSGGAPGVAQPATPAAPGAPPATPQAGKNGLTSVALASRSLVYTAALTVRTKDVQGATANAEHLALANGGFVGDEKATSGTVPNTAGITQSTVTLRVPSDKFDTVLGRLGAGGAVEQQTRSASDVTDQVVDTASRIASAQAGLARISELMKSATGLADVVALEGELSRREADLESMKTRLAALQDQVQLSTITVTYLVPEAPGPAAPAPAKERNALQRGLHDGWTAFLGVVKVLLIVGGAVLPFALLGAVLWWPVRRLMRLRPGYTPPAPAPPRGERRPGGSPSSGAGGGADTGPASGDADSGPGSGPGSDDAQRASGERSSASAAAVADGSK